VSARRESVKEIRYGGSRSNSESKYHLPCRLLATIGKENLKVKPKHRDDANGGPPLREDSGQFILTHFTLDRQSGLPLYLQIAHELMYLIETGVLRDGDAPPSLRRLAKQLRISFLTVDKAYKWLEARGVLATRRGIGWKVALIREHSEQDARERLRLTKFVDETLSSAIQNGFDPMAFARNMVHRATAVEQRVPSRKLAFVECHSEYVDDYVAELRRELSEFNVEIRGMLTDSLIDVSKRACPEREFLKNTDYVLTTFYHSGFVQQVVSPLKRRIVTLSLALNKEALYKVVSLPSKLRVGAILGPTDPAPTIVKSLEYYRDQPAGSIPYAIVTDSAAVKRLRAKTDSIAYTIACQDQVNSFLKKNEIGILLRFGPAENDIRKVRALLGSSARTISASPATGTGSASKMIR
jgi:DNA-binding transcriptional regulator YhcF (GntR family)